MDARDLASLLAPSASLLHANRTVRLRVASLADEILVAETVRGWEALDAGYLLQVSALSTDAHLDLKAILGQPALLELQTDRSSYRPFHGRVTAVVRTGSNGGLARYQLQVEPGLAMLRHSRDTYVFRDMTWEQITQQILAWHPELAPPLRLDLQDSSAYLRHDTWTMYEESALAALQRLWADEGVFCFYEHAGDVASETLGSHTLVLADHNAAFAPQQPERYAFHRRDATEPLDTLQQLRTRSRLRPSQVARASWDYRSLNHRPVSASCDAPIVLEDSDVPDVYAYHTQAEGDRRARQHLDSLRRDARALSGVGSARRLSAGQRFTVSSHPSIADDQEWVCRSVHFQARNNLDAEVVEAAQQLGRALEAAPPLPVALSGNAALLPLSGRTVSDVAFYQSTFDAFPIQSPYRPQTTDGHGRQLYPRPQVSGLLEGIVVGDGNPITTDRDHRVRVQLVSRRGSQSSSGLTHWSDSDNAPAAAGATAWVRVATSLTGDNFGTVWIPRVGQLVYLVCLEGQADRMVVVGSGYDGRGNADAAHNQVAGGQASATGNAPAWFEGNDHGAVLGGFKTQALASSQQGSGGYNQLVFDSTPKQARIELSTTQADTALTLGHQKLQRDNLREADRGFGTEIRTQAGAALRAGKGLLITSEPGEQQLSAPLVQSQLQQSGQLLSSLSQTAHAQQVTLPGDPAPDRLPAHKTLQEVEEALAASQSGSTAGAGFGGGDGLAPAWSMPLQVVSSPAGIAALTPADLVAVSGTQTVHAANQDLNWAVQDTLAVAVAQSIQLFTHGQANGDKPNQETGIALHAASGAVQVRVLKNSATFQARRAVNIASAQADVLLAAPSSHLLATAGGAYVKLEGGNIELGAPGIIEFKATRKELAGPQSATISAPTLPSSTLKGCSESLLDAAGSGGLTA